MSQDNQSFVKTVKTKERFQRDDTKKRKEKERQWRRVDKRSQEAY